MKNVRAWLIGVAVFVVLSVVTSPGALAAVTGTVSRWVGNGLVFDGTAGDNAWTFDVNGLRADFGTGANDYATSDGTTVTFVGPLAAGTLATADSFTTPVMTLTDTQAVTGDNGPEFTTNVAQPASGGAAYVFVVPTWNDPQNAMFLMQNQGGTSVIIDIFGNVGPPVGAVNNNFQLLDRLGLIPVPADGDLIYVTADTDGFIEMADIVYSYDTDGTAGGDNTFLMTATDGVDTATVSLPCDSAGVSIDTATEAAWGGTTTFNNHATIAIAFDDVTDCAVPPAIHNILIHHVYTTAP